MKTIIYTIFLLAYTSISIAYDGQSSIAFKYNGESEIQKSIQTRIMRTIYEQRIINDTCWNGPYSYPCQRVIQVPVQILDNIHTQVDLYFENNNENIINSFFRLFYDQQAGEHLLVLKNEVNENTLVLGKVINYSENRIGRTYLKRNISVTLKFQDNLKETLSPIFNSISDLRVEDLFLTFNTSKIYNLDNFYVHLKVSNKKTFSEKIIFNDYVDNNNLDLSPFGDKLTTVMIDLDKLLNEYETNKKYSIELTVGINLGDYIILNENYATLPHYRNKNIKSIIK